MAGEWTVTDDELYRRVRQGDAGALEALVHRYHGPLLRFLYRSSGDLHLAHDLVQETFTRILVYRGQPPRRFRAWVYAIAANLLKDHYHSAPQLREQLDPFNPLEQPGSAQLPVDTAPGADELLLRDAERREVVAALLELPPAYREALILRFYHGLPLAEIAEITGAPLGTVKSRIFHALRHLKARFAAEGGMDHDQPDALATRTAHRRSRS